jgi:hypothetical protein
VGPQNPNDGARDITRDLKGMTDELAALKGDATNRPEGPEYEACATAWRLRTRLC